MKPSKAQFRLTFTTPILGSSPAAADLVVNHIQPKDLDPTKSKEEVETLPALSPEDLADAAREKSTVFPRDENGLFMWDYQIRGMFKEGIGVLVEFGDVKTVTKWTHKRAVDATLFVNPRRAYFYGPDGNYIKEPAGFNVRPLRATTMQGERICLARSEYLPEGTSLDFEVALFERPDKTKKSNVAAFVAADLSEVLNYGEFKGTGQWRSGGWGRFTWSELKESDYRGLVRVNPVLLPRAA